MGESKLATNKMYASNKYLKPYLFPKFFLNLTLLQQSDYEKGPKTLTTVI